MDRGSYGVLAEYLLLEVETVDVHIDRLRVRLPEGRLSEGVLLLLLVVGEDLKDFGALLGLLLDDCLLEEAQLELA